MGVAVLFGGCGFIGVHFARHLIDNLGYKRVYLADIELPDLESDEYRAKLLRDDRIDFVEVDVRHAIEWRPVTNVNLIANFAAVHREPGHAPREYYETNINGAENICKWAQAVACDQIVFTSSIAPYGVQNVRKMEETLPVPDTPYGGSKLVAEQIHRTWQARDMVKRSLVVIRPGVVFGPTEGGNVTRMIKALRSRYFFYAGNRATKKAGIYVKELPYIISWALKEAEQMAGLKSPIICNACMPDSPALEQWVVAICSELRMKRSPVNVPISLLYVVASVANAFCKLLGISTPLHPRRVTKLNNSNDIEPAFLLKSGYEFRYGLDAALSEWRTLNERDWT